MGVTVQEQPEVDLSTAAIQKELVRDIEVPDECVCDYLTVQPYGLLQRVINPECEAEHASELERVRDE